MVFRRVTEACCFATEKVWDSSLRTGMFITQANEVVVCSPRYIVHQKFCLINKSHDSPRVQRYCEEDRETTRAGLLMTMIVPSRTYVT